MTNQKQLKFEGNHNSQDHSISLTFTAPIKAGCPDLDLLIAEIARDAEKRRRTDDKSHPYYAIDLIRQSRLGALRLPVELGGGGASIRDLFYVVIRLAEADQMSHTFFGLTLTSWKNFFLALKMKYVILDWLKWQMELSLVMQ